RAIRFCCRHLVVTLNKSSRSIGNQHDCGTCCDVSSASKSVDDAFNGAAIVGDENLQWSATKAGLKFRTIQVMCGLKKAYATVTNIGDVRIWRQSINGDGVEPAKDGGNGKRTIRLHACRACTQPHRQSCKRCCSGGIDSCNAASDVLGRLKGDNNIAAVLS